MKRRLDILFTEAVITHTRMLRQFTGEAIIIIMVEGAGTGMAAEAATEMATEMATDTTAGDR